MMRLVVSDNSLELDPTYESNFESGLERMLEEVSKEEPLEDDNG